MKNRKCIIMKVCESKHNEEGIEKESRNISIGNCGYYEFIYIYLCVWLGLVVCLCLATFG